MRHATPFSFDGIRDIPVQCLARFSFAQMILHKI